MSLEFRSSNLQSSVNQLGFHGTRGKCYNMIWVGLTSDFIYASGLLPTVWDSSRRMIRRHAIAISIRPVGVLQYGPVGMWNKVIYNNTVLRSVFCVYVYCVYEILCLRLHLVTQRSVEYSYVRDTKFQFSFIDLKKLVYSWTKILLIHLLTLSNEAKESLSLPINCPPICPYKL